MANYYKFLRRLPRRGVSFPPFPPAMEFRIPRLMEWNGSQFHIFLWNGMERTSNYLLSDDRRKTDHGLAFVRCLRVVLPGKIDTKVRYWMDHTCDAVWMMCSTTTWDVRRGHFITSCTSAAKHSWNTVEHSHKSQRFRHNSQRLRNVTPLTQRIVGLRYPIAPLSLVASPVASLIANPTPLFTVFQYYGKPDG